jgi:hypothetical protein
MKTNFSAAATLSAVLSLSGCTGSGTTTLTKESNNKESLERAFIPRVKETTKPSVKVRATVKIQDDEVLSRTFHIDSMGTCASYPRVMSSLTGRDVNVICEGDNQIITHNCRSSSDNFTIRCTKKKRTKAWK